MLPRGGAARLLPGGNEVVPNFPAPPNNMDVALPPFQRCAGSSRINSPPPPTHTHRGTLQRFVPGPPCRSGGVQGPPSSPPAPRAAAV